MNKRRRFKAKRRRQDRVQLGRFVAAARELPLVYLTRDIPWADYRAMFNAD